MTRIVGKPPQVADTPAAATAPAPLATGPLAPLPTSTPAATATATATSFEAQDPAAAAKDTIASPRDRVVNEARELLDQAKSALATYFSSKTNREVAGIRAASVVVGTVRLGLTALRTLPVAGNILNAVCALLDAAKAGIRSAAFLRDEDNVHVRDLVGDWTKVAADVAGIFFPPAFLAGTATSAVISAYGMAANHIRRDAAEGAGIPEGGTVA